MKKYLLSLDQDIHRELKHIAVENDMTINEVIVDILKAYLPKEPEGLRMVREDSQD